jgi:hypothetical protein
VSVAITHETPAFSRLEDSGLEDPEILSRVAERDYWLGVDALTVTPLGES